MNDLTKRWSKPTAEKARQLMHLAGQRYISDQQLEEEFESAKKFAMEEEQKNDELNMMFVLLMRRRQDADSSKAEEEWLRIPAVVGDWPPKDKYATMEQLGAKVARDFPDYLLVGVVQMTEAWQASYHEEDHDPENPTRLLDHVAMPSERAEREEVLIVDVCSIDQRQFSAFIPIIRKSSGKFGTWGAPTEFKYDASKPDDNSVERRNYLSLSLFKGSTSVGAARGKTL